MALYYNDSTKLYVVQMNTCSADCGVTYSCSWYQPPTPNCSYKKELTVWLMANSTNFWILYGGLLLFILTVNILVHRVFMFHVYQMVKCLCLGGWDPLFSRRRLGVHAPSTDLRLARLGAQPPHLARRPPYRLENNDDFYNCYSAWWINKVLALVYRVN